MARLQRQLMLKLVLVASALGTVLCCEYPHIEYEKLLALENKEFSFLMIKKACVDQEVRASPGPWNVVWLACTNHDQAS